MVTYDRVDRGVDRSVDRRPCRKAGFGTPSGTCELLLGLGALESFGGLAYGPAARSTITGPFVILGFGVWRPVTVYCGRVDRGCRSFCRP
jgi:hypothetical protein